MSDENLRHKDYSKHSPRILNRLIKLRIRQIEKTEAGIPTTDKGLAQLRHELNCLMNTLMEHHIAKDSEIKGSRTEE